MTVTVQSKMNLRIAIGCDDKKTNIIKGRKENERKKK